MSSFIAVASTASTATTAALGRFHTSAKSGHSIQSSTGRQRSSSFTSRGNSTNFPTSSSPASSYSPTISSKRPTMGSDTTLSKGLYQENHVAHRDLSLPASSQISPSYSNYPIMGSVSPTTLSANTRAQQQRLNDGRDRINLVPSATDHSFNISNTSNGTSTGSQVWQLPPSPTDQNNDLHGDQELGNTPTICTGRSRSNTLTTTNTDAVEVAAASIMNQYEHVMRPRRSSLANRSAGPGSHSAPVLPTIVFPETTQPSNTIHAPHSHYPPEPILPQYYDVDEAKGTTSGVLGSSSASSLLWANMQLGFLPRIVILIGLFGASLGGLYLLAQVLPPLSLPKSIDDVKVDAAILQEFATATYEGWIRTFWVFSVVYMWKQCFGIPGSAFLNILAGALYGPWFGTVLTSLLTTLGSVLAYFMSFFLMEPILNRYASSRLDQMRLQVQKKTMRSAGKKVSRSGSTATSTAVQTSINVSTSSCSPSDATVSADSSVSTPQQGATLRTRSSSFTARRTETAQQDMSSGAYFYPQLTNVPSAAAPTHHYYHQHQRADAGIQESEGLLSDDRTVESSVLSIDHQEAEENKDPEADEDQDESEEGTSLFMQLLLIRLFPLTPYWFINLASPLVGVPVVPFMTSMFLGCMPYNYICAQAGAILSEIHEMRDIYQQPWILFQVVLVLVLSGAAVIVSKRTKKKQVERDQRKSRKSEEEAVDDESTQHLLRSTFEIMERHQSQQAVDEERQRENIAMSSLDSQHASSHYGNKHDSAIVDMSNYRY